MVGCGLRDAASTKTSSAGQREDAAAIPLRVWLAVLDQGLVEADLQRTLPKLKAPTLLIWGSADPIMEEEVRQSLREALPYAQVKVSRAWAQPVLGRSAALRGRDQRFPERRRLQAQPDPGRLAESTKPAGLRR